MTRKFTRFAGYGIKCEWPIFKTEMLIYQSTANLEEKILFGKTTYDLDPKVRKMLKNDKFGNEDSTFHSGP